MNIHGHDEREVEWGRHGRSLPTLDPTATLATNDCSSEHPSSLIIPRINRACPVISLASLQLPSSGPWKFRRSCPRIPPFDRRVTGKLTPFSNASLHIGIAGLGNTRNHFFMALIKFEFPGIVRLVDEVREDRLRIRVRTGIG